MRHRPIALAASLLLASAASQAANPVTSQDTQYTPRGRAVHAIVLKWAPHVQEAYKTSPSAWARSMASTFAKADLKALEQAALANNFEVMTSRLLDSAPSQLAMNKTLATAATPAALGDAASDLVYVPVTPCRIIDTRVAGGAIAANTTRSFDVTATTTYASQGGAANDCGGTGSAGSFAAAVINFTVVSPSAAGYITAFPYLASQPLAATVNYTAGDIRGNLAIVKLDQSSAADELTVYSFAQTHLVADIVGYMITPAATNLDCVSTSVLSSAIAANSTNFFNNPICPAGYKATTPYCWTATSGVYSQGSGYNANSASNATFCSWQNTTGASQTVFGGNVCCRVPGR